MKTTRLLFRWGVWMCYSEWKSDQPNENWSGELLIQNGRLSNPNLIIYSGLFGPQHKTLIPLESPHWKSHIDYPRPSYGYKGLEGLEIDVESNENSRLCFKSNMINVEFNLDDIPVNDWLIWNVGPKYSCSQLIVCRIEDEGIYWNNHLIEKYFQGLNPKVFGIDAFKGNYLKRLSHHRMAGWIPPGGKIKIPFDWKSNKPAIITWYFTAGYWNPLSQTAMTEYFSGLNSPELKFKTELDGIELGSCKFKVKYMRGALSSLEHTNELDIKDNTSEHTLSITNFSEGNTYLILYQLLTWEQPVNWPLIKKCLPFQPIWLAERQQLGDVSKDVPTNGQGILVGYDMNTMAAENGWIDAVLNYLVNTNCGNYVLFRTETDFITKDDWQRWFSTCKNNNIYYAINYGLLPSAVDKDRLPAKDILEMAKSIGGKYFYGLKNHEVSIRIYSGWNKVDVPENTNLQQAEDNFLSYIKDSYSNENCRRIIGEAMLAHRYDYKAGIETILSETMTGNNCLLLSEARGAAKAYNRDIWGIHIACHVHCTPEDWRHERMFWLNLYIGYLSGASIIEDEEGGLAKVHSFVSGPSDPLPLTRQRTMADFYKWASENPRPSKLKVEIGLIYGRHEIITGGLSLNSQRPVRVWESFGPALPEWEYGHPEYGWLIVNIFLPGVWMCPILNEKENLRRWFTGTPYGQIDIVPIEADFEHLASYKLLIFPGWHTMVDSDIDKLIDYAANGGTLVIGLCHMQTSPDRTMVLSSTNWNFVNNDNINNLSGFKLNNKQNFKTIKNIKIMDILLTTGKPAVMIDDTPLIIENKIGKGKVFTCTALEYLGHPDLVNHLENFIRKLMPEINLDIRIQDESNEIMYFVYQSENHKEVFLLNTDWTKADNVKKCCLFNKNISKEIQVKQGEVTRVTI